MDAGQKSVKRCTYFIKSAPDFDLDDSLFSLSACSLYFLTFAALCSSLHLAFSSISCLFLSISSRPTLVLQEKKKVRFYIVQYPVCRTAQSTLHFIPLADLFIPIPTQLLAFQPCKNYARNYSLTFSPLYMAGYSFMQPSEPGRHGENENGQTSKR